MKEHDIRHITIKVEITTPLNEVLQEMSERKIGAAVVVKSGELAGRIKI